LFFQFEIGTVRCGGKYCVELTHHVVALAHPNLTQKKYWEILINETNSNFQQDYFIQI
jgi:hypothetical protein